MKIFVVAMVTIFIRGLNHFNIVMNFKYQYIRVMLSYKKLILRLSCFCSTPTVSQAEGHSDDTDTLFTGCCSQTAAIEIDIAQLQGMIRII